MIAEANIYASHVTYRISGPLGTGYAEGPKKDWKRVRARARYDAGYRAEP